MTKCAKVAYAIGFMVGLIGEFAGFCGMLSNTHNLDRFEVWASVEFGSCALTLVLIFNLAVRPALREIGMQQFRRRLQNIDVEG